MQITGHYPWPAEANDAVLPSRLPGGTSLGIHKTTDYRSVRRKYIRWNSESTSGFAKVSREKLCSDPVSVLKEGFLPLISAIEGTTYINTQTGSL